MKQFLSIILLISCIFIFLKAQNITKKEYVCPPCGSECDIEIYDAPGTCKHCSMDLIEKSLLKSFQNISIRDLCQELAKKSEVILLDVRTEGEFAGTRGTNYGHLKNAINIPIQELDKRLNELSAYKDKEIIVYCSHSVRSPRACMLLAENGFKNLKNMSNGMSKWDAESDKDCTSSLLIK